MNNLSNNLKKLEDILKKCIENGWQPFNKYLIELNISDTTLIIKMKDDFDVMEYLVNFNDIFSPESWLLQFVKWKENKNIWLFLDPEIKFFEEFDSYEIEEKESRCSDSFEYHTMRMSVLPVDQKIIYFLDNIDLWHQQQ